MPSWGQSGFPGGDPFALSPDMFDAYPIDSSSFAPVAYGNDGTATEPASQQRPVPFLEDSLPQPSQMVGFSSQHHNWVAAPGRQFNKLKKFVKKSTTNCPKLFLKLLQCPYCQLKKLPKMRLTNAPKVQISY